MENKIGQIILSISISNSRNPANQRDNPIHTLDVTKIKISRNISLVPALLNVESLIEHRYHGDQVTRFSESCHVAVDPPEGRNSSRGFFLSLPLPLSLSRLAPWQHSPIHRENSGIIKYAVTTRLNYELQAANWKRVIYRR